MKFLLITASLFIFGTASAQTGFTQMTKLQMDSAMTSGRALVTAKLADLKAAHASNNAAQFQTYAGQYAKLMRHGMMESGRILDLDPAIDLKAGKAKFSRIEFTYSDYRNLLDAQTLNRAEIIKKAEYFQSLY